MDLDLGRRSIAEWAEGAPNEVAESFVPAREKFKIEMPIGKGGMAEVFLVTDQDLKRQVAMKIQRSDLGGGREARLQFVAEAQATSQLEHPGIPPVHDIGLTEDGRPYFTMKLVRGRTLREVLHDLALQRREVQREYTVHQLVTILERIAEALEFAHERGVVHRDIKPENVMLGDYGEVHLLDWGLARIGTESSEFEHVETARTQRGLETQAGQIKGTPAYMSPEQASGEPVDSRTDIYALGCLLYEVLTLHSAFDPQDRGVFLLVQEGKFVDVAERNASRRVPESLAATCRKAMAFHADARFASASEMREALRSWLDGRAQRQHRRQEAEKLVALGKQAVAKYEDLKRQVGEAEDAEEAEVAKHQPYQPIAEKLSLFEARKRVGVLKAQVALAFEETTHLLNAALTQDSSNVAARAALADLWKQRLLETEERGAEEDQVHAFAMAKRYADGPIPSDGSLSLVSNPPGAKVLLYRYEEVGGLLSPQHETLLGTTPLESTTLPMGSYLCVLEKAGFRDTRYPVHITRERVWEGAVRLRTEAELGADFVNVPAGPFTYGEGKQQETKTLPDFAIAEFPVTFREYAEFLNSLDETEGERRCPMAGADDPYMKRGADGRYAPCTNIIRGPARRRCLREFGPDCEADLPVIGASWLDAVAYCEWRSRTTGQRWRLPTEEEHEKAARGVDGRRFPWGDVEDASLARCLNSRKEAPQPEPVGAFPTAVSVYGMRDASGNVWEWTNSQYDSRRSSRVLRGGSWYIPMAYLRCAFRFAGVPRFRDSNVGFRCARSL